MCVKESLNRVCSCHVEAHTNVDQFLQALDGQYFDCVFLDMLIGQDTNGLRVLARGNAALAAFPYPLFPCYRST